MAMNTYALVNPMIVGTMKTSVDAPNSSSAAIELYNRLSPYFATTQPNFIFTIQKLKSNKQLGGGTSNSYHSFRVKEVEQNGEVVFVISTYAGNVNLTNLKSSIDRVKERMHKGTDLADSEKQMKPSNLDQSGGKRKHRKFDDDEDDDVFNDLLEELDDEESEIFPKRKTSKINLMSTSNLNYITELAVPVLVDPIQYYWYSPVVYEVPKVIIPNFISTIIPQVIIDLGI